MTPERFGQGMAFDEYVAYAGTPENLAREAGSWLGPQRRDFSGLLRDWYGRARLHEAQAAAVRWLAAQANGPARILVISEEWSSDCRRDVPMLARLAEAGRMELRIFTRDGRTVGRGAQADPDLSPNADIVNGFLRVKDGRTWQSIPVAVFYTRRFEYLYHYIELPAIYHKERLYTAMQVARPGETRDQAWERFLRDWLALQQSPFFPLWASAAVDEILSALHERIVTGSEVRDRAGARGSA
ncbi:MAG TPA: thioredoxin family protein [Candidatus Acidoferrum sp.]|nr:thioredoxin family protein [Candidatus Acidoferrum sp.]